MAIVFRNPGKIDPRAITTFGVSAKETDSPIGYFGTGMKYAIAILLREGCKITVWSGEDRYNFALAPTVIRSQNFNIVSMNDQPLGFTTDLGKNWEIWQAYRELYCNTLDEGGSADKESLPVQLSEDETVVCVEGDKFERCFTCHSDYFLTTDALKKCGDIEIHPGTSNHVYYRGVRVGQLSKPSRFTYNLLDHVDLTEDRTMKSEFEAQWNIARGLLECSDSAILSDVLGSDGFFEGRLEFNGSPSPQFVAVCESLKGHDDVNPYALEVCRKDIGSLKVRAVPITLDVIDENRLQTAKRFLLTIGYDVSEYDVVITDCLGPNVLGQAAHGTIFVSPRAFGQGAKMVANVLLEEYLHLKYGLHDKTVKMQNFLFEIIMNLAERATGTALDDECDRSEKMEAA